MAEHVKIPVRDWDKCKWAQLNYFGTTHEVCGEKVREKDGGYSFAGNHRVRLYTFKNNVHWKIPQGVRLDISQVTPENPPRRRQG